MQGKQQRAIPIFRTAGPVSRRVLGPADRDTATILENLGKTYFEADQWSLAEPVAACVLEVRRKKLRRKY